MYLTVRTGRCFLMKNKSRLLEILDLLHRNTDSDHYETTVSILEYLQANDIPVDRKTLQSDMELLRDKGYGISKIKSSPNKYAWDDRLFKEAELQMLVDAVLSAKFISESKSKDLVRRISCLTSKYNAERLKSQMDCLVRPKSENLEVYHTVNIITDAIKNRKRISFKYTEYNEHKVKVYRNGGKNYRLSPYKLLWNEDYYYVIGYDEKHKDIISFRIDRMEKCRQLEGKYVRAPEEFDIKDYVYKFFKMYDGDDAVIELEVDNELMKYIIDKFGIDVETKVKTESTFSVKAPVKLSPTLYSWVFQFAGKIRITGPEAAVEQYRKMKEI